jgi:hypothetical protein
MIGGSPPRTVFKGSSMSIEVDQVPGATTEDAAENNAPAADSAAASNARQATANAETCGTARGGALGLWWAGLTIGAVAATYLVADWGSSSKAVTAGVWAVHNLVGWSVTLRALRRSIGQTAVRRQTLETWSVAAAAMWAIIATTQLSDALADWAAVTMIQIVVGLALVSTGASVRDGLATVCGLVCIVSAPVLLALGESANPGLWSVLIMIGGLVTSIFSISCGWRKMRMAAQRRADG